MISDEIFGRYEKIKRSGVTNMMDVKTVCLLAGISRDEYFQIVKNYSTLKESFVINQEINRERANEYEEEFREDEE